MKDQSVETLRGVAIILVVMGHVIGFDKLGGMKVADDSFWRHIYFSFEFLRMPLFTMISGWVYSLRPANFEIFRSFTIKKIRRILLPMVFVGTLYFVFQYITPGTNAKGNLSEIWKIYIFPYTQFWYLPALFLVFVIASLIDSLNLAYKLWNWSLITFIAFLIMIFFKMIVPESVPNILAFKNAIYLFPFFLLGIGIKRFNSIFSNKYLFYVTLFLLIILLVFQQLVWFKFFDWQLSKRDGIGLLIGIIGSVVLLNIKWSVKWLIWIGSFAYTIFLFHGFGTAAGRIIFLKSGLSNSFLVFFASLLTGIFLPIVIEYLFNKNSILRMILLGKSYNKNSKD